jgi:serine phosphatase RsbU (regulator of sigma subunit)
MQYTQLTFEYKYDTLAEAIYNREIEYFHYELDLKNYIHMMTTLPEGDFKRDIENRIVETQKQMAIVENIYSALKNQIDDEAAYAVACTKLQAKRATQS